MPYSGGSYSRPSNSFSNPVVNTAINETAADALFDDFEAAFNYHRFVHLTAQHSVSATTATEVTGLQVTIAAAGTYRFSYFLICQTSNASDGLAFGINYTGTATKIISMLSWPDAGVTAAVGQLDDVANATTGQIVAYAVSRSETTTAPDLSTGTGGATNANQNIFMKIEGILVASDTGDLELWHASESTNATTVEIGSNVQVTRVA